MLRRLFVLLSLVLAGSATAQDRLQSPAEFLGYELGTRFTPHHRVVAYFEHVAAHSPRVRLERYGETYEGRPLLVAYVATPERLARLDAVRTDNLRRAGLAEGAPSDDAPALVWLSYNVHGNESVSTEAALATLYDLANPDDARTRAWLQDAVVILDPCINPDGRERYVQWYNRTVGRTFNANPDAREHHEPWPGGRTNHYLFDLNRDWAWGTQQETRRRLALYQRWMPHVHVDFHEQGVNEPYYFAPAAEPFHEAITPWQREFQGTIGRNHMRYFDASGWLYFTRQVFDLLYPGYGDTWPLFNGAIGMTYEQGGGGRAGLGIQTAEGDTLSLRDRIAHHHTTGLSTIEAAATHHARLVAEFQAYFERARTRPEGPYRAYLVRATNDAGTLAALEAHLEAQGLSFGYATRARTVRGLAYATGQTGPVAVTPGDLVVPAAQPRGVLARVLFDPRPALSDSLTYDVTAWALPYVYGLDAYALTDAVPDVAATPPAAEAAPEGPDHPYAYLVAWKSFDDARFLADVLGRGIRVRFATKPFEVDGRAYDPGTLILTRRGNEALGDAFDRDVRAAAGRFGQALHAVASGAATRGADFGSGDVAYLDRPRVAVLAGDVVSSASLGEIWHFFDEQLGYPATLVEADDLGRLDLTDYDVLILPSGRYGDLLTDARRKALLEWVRSGGRLLALPGAAAFLAGKEGFHLQAKKHDDEADDEPDALPRYGDRDRDAASDEVPGSIFRVHLDPSHPLAFGYGDVYFSLKRGDDAYAFLEQGDWNVGTLRAGDPVSGFAGFRARRKLADTLVFGVQEAGRGRIVYFIDDPLFRAFWYSGRLLFGNAVFLVGQR